MILSKIFKIILLLLSIFTIIIIFYFIHPLFDKMAQNISQKSILSLELNMTKQTVINILGKPLKKIKNSQDVTQTQLNTAIQEFNLTHLILHSEKDTNEEIFCYGENNNEINLIFKNNRLMEIGLEYLDTYYYECNTLKCPKIINMFLFRMLIPNKKYEKGL